MARCEDFPCCGHELGCCPDYDDSGRQMNMICVCGAVLPVNARYSICDGCMNSPDLDDPDYDRQERVYHDDEFDDSMDGDHESGLASAGFGTDEDYGGHGQEFVDEPDFWGDEGY